MWFFVCVSEPFLHQTNCFKISCDTSNDFKFHPSCTGNFFNFSKILQNNGKLRKFKEFKTTLP